MSAFGVVVVMVMRGRRIGVEGLSLGEPGAKATQILCWSNWEVEET